LRQKISCEANFKRINCPKRLKSLAYSDSQNTKMNCIKPYRLCTISTVYRLHQNWQYFERNASTESRKVISHV
jgi:hypothetical protein